MPQTEDLKSQTRQIKKNVSSTANSIADNAEGFMSDTLDTMRGYSDRAKDAARDAGDQTVSFIRRHPINVALGAACVGVIAGLFLARRRK